MTYRWSIKGQSEWSKFWIPKDFEWTVHKNLNSLIHLIKELNSQSFNIRATRSQDGPFSGESSLGAPFTITSLDLTRKTD